MKKFFTLICLTLLVCQLIWSQIEVGKSAKANMPAFSNKASEAKFATDNPKFLMIHKEKDSPFEIYQDLQLDELVIRLKNQFDVLRFELRNEKGETMPVKGAQDKNEVHANLHDLANGTYRLIIDRNAEKLFTEITLNR